MKRPRSHSSVSQDPWASLREQAENLLLENSRTETTTLIPRHLGQQSSNTSYSFPIPCRQAESVQESTSTLLTARAYAKAGYTQLAWQALEALFSVQQATTGMLPKYRYARSASNDNTHYYVNNTDIPNWILFQNFTRVYSPPLYHHMPRHHARSSGRITALPLHASMVLQVYYLSNQTKTDTLHLKRHFERLYKQHDVIHSVVMRACHSNHYHQSNNNNNPSTPCYNVVHPWETIIPDAPFSLYWNDALSQVKDMMKNRGWKPPVRSDYHNDASLFLLECMSNATQNCTSTMDCEDSILSECSFAMLDVGYAAALSRSDDDLLKMAHILQDLRIMEPTDELSSKLLRMEAWKEQSTYVLDDLLWNDEKQTYLSRYIVFDKHSNNDNNHATFVPHESKWLDHAVSNNFMSLWTTLKNDSRRDAMVFHMMQHLGKFAFDCGPYPLWNVGGCFATNKTAATISPFLNHLVARGLEHNHAIGTSHYLMNSTLNLVCGLPNTLYGNNHTCSNARNISFWNDYFGRTGLPLTFHPICGETISAATIYNILVADPPFHYTPAPPIGSSWIIAIVICELVVAFLIGVSCLLLNLSLMRRLNRDTSGSNGNGDGLFRNSSEGAAGDMQYFSAAASLEEAQEEQEIRMIGDGCSRGGRSDMNDS